jgi:UDP-N-acetylglucosamine 4,6-dehydratase/5-epimerase
MILDGMKMLLTGGTGSFGKALIRRALRSNPAKLIIFSRDELKQYEMSLEISDPRVQYFIGDVRDKDRLSRAFDGVDYVIHAAALKQIPSCEYNPFEAIKTNVIGAQNVMEVAIDRGVSRVVALSTDKAVNPISLYGATKLCSDKLFVSGNSYTGNKKTKFSVVRYGNVMGSRGSVIPLFLKLKEEGKKVFPVTHPDMTRFWITLDDAVDLVIFALENMIGGEIYVPKIPSMKIIDLALAIDEDAEINFVGIRPGEKLHEVMITEDDARTTKEFREHYVIEPVFHWWRGNGEDAGKFVKTGFKYSSDKNDRWLSVSDLKRLLGLEVNIPLGGQYCESCQ